MSLKVIQDALKEFAQSFQASTAFPSAIAVLLNIYFVLPHFLELELASTVNITLAVATTLLLSYTFYAFNYPLMRLFEGYEFKYGQWLPKLFAGSLEKYRAEFVRRWGEIQSLHIERRQPGIPEHRRRQLDVELGRLESNFEFDYPSAAEMVLPTRLGNTVAAFEDYPSKRYGMDAIALWPRLVPVLKEQGYLDTVAQEKSVFDFLLNMCVVVVGIGLEMFLVKLYVGELGTALSLLVIAAVAACVLYQGLIMAAQQWGLVVRVAFDLYRHRLHERLGLHDAESFAAEYDQWRQISQFFLFRRKYWWFKPLMTCKEVIKRQQARE